MVDWESVLRRHGAATALIAESGERMSYTDLAGLARQFADRLGPSRRLVVLQPRNNVPSIVALLGCLVGRHPAILLPAGQDFERIRARFEPDALWSADSDELRFPQDAAGGLHPELQLLLSTSGSTGSPRLVRLSAGAIHANASAIATYLEISPVERAVTTLPLHYSYGLSVLTSHLLAGASILVTDAPVTHPRFEALLHRHRPSSLAGVPLLHRQLLASGLARRMPPSVTTLTQAGGRMPAEEVEEMIAAGDACGFRFIPMYGQTEATARMAWLPADLARTHPDYIGRPIPGGSFRLEDAGGNSIRSAGVAGELIYSGPNVMMGYADSRADLFRGAEIGELRTGDIAERTETGLYRIVGRKSRFAKIAGHRIGFDDMEALFRAEGINATVTGTDGLLVAHLGPEAADTDLLVARVAAATQLPEPLIVPLSGPMPLLPSGKPDMPAILLAGKQLADERRAQLSRGAHPILAGYRQAFRNNQVERGASFKSLGGDSLAYVSCAMAVEQALGELPPGWEDMSIDQLVGLCPQAPGTGGTVRVESDIFVRCLALIAIIIGHAAPSVTGWLRGGLGVLVLLAGYSFARFRQDAFERGEIQPGLAGTFERLVLPYMAVMVPMLMLSRAPVDLAWFTLTSVFFVHDTGPLRYFWIVETQVHMLLVMAALFAIPAVRHASARDRFTLGLALFGGAILLRLAALPLHAGSGSTIDKTFDAWLGFYVLGMLAAATAGLRRPIILSLGIALSFWEFGPQSSRAWWLIGGLIPLLWLPTLPMARWLARPLLRITAAGYFIYLMHAPLLHLMIYHLGLRDKPLLSAALLLPASIVAGILFERAWGRVIAWIGERRLSGDTRPA